MTLTLLGLEYCDQCRQSGEIPYESTQFSKYYHDHVVKTKATMHINRKPGELMAAILKVDEKANVLNDGYTIWHNYDKLYKWKG